LEGLIGRRLEQISHRRASVDAVMAVQQRYRSRYHGWNVKHFYAWYRREGGTRSCSWVKSRLQEVGLVAKASVSFEGITLQIPQDRVRMHYAKVKVRVLRYPDGDLAVFHGPRLLARFGTDGQPLVQEVKKPRNRPTQRLLMALGGYGLRPALPENRQVKTGPFYLLTTGLHSAITLQGKPGVELVDETRGGSGFTPTQSSPVACCLHRRSRD